MVFNAHQKCWIGSRVRTSDSTGKHQTPQTHGTRAQACRAWACLSCSPIEEGAYSDPTRPQRVCLAHLKILPLALEQDSRTLAFYERFCNDFRMCIYLTWTHFRISDFAFQRCSQNALHNVSPQLVWNQYNIACFANQASITHPLSSWHQRTCGFKIAKYAFEN